VVAATRWIELAGHLSLVYQPARAIAARPQPVPLLISLPAAGETAPASVERWRSAADADGFVLAVVNRGADPQTPEAQARLVDDLSKIAHDVRQLQPIDLGRWHLAAFAAATPLAYRGAFEAHSGDWASVAFVGGVPDGDWLGAPAAAAAKLVSTPPPLFYAASEADGELAAAKACAAELARRGVTVTVEAVSGSLSKPPAELAARAWAWLAKHRAKGS
jgi:hypothetical protein